ncbi:hypothetical protein E4U21_002001 [Claviceps maximensis]|nr:hypothetical protein E4U21_002001 [Claviceps maximensis]
MSQTSVTEPPGLPQTFLDVLSCDMTQLVRFLDRNRVPEGFCLSSLTGHRELSREQKLQVAERVKKALPHLDPQAINADDLAARLATIAQNQENGVAPAPAALFFSGESMPTEAMASYIACRQEIIRGGCRPVCSVEELFYLRKNALARCEKIIPWLDADPHPLNRINQIIAVLDDQFDRWWEFRKSQWVNRGDLDAELGFPYYLEALGRKTPSERTHSPRHTFQMRHIWRREPAGRQVSDDDDENAYQEAVARRLAPYRFSRAWQFKEDPLQQSPWTTWLEYVSFEKWHLEELLASAESLEEQHIDAWNTMVKAAPQPSMEETYGWGGERGGIGNSSSGASPRMIKTSTSPSPEPSEKETRLTKELESVRMKLAETTQALEDFIRDATPYVKKQKQIFYQRKRVEWAVKEARLFDAELAQQEGEESAEKAAGQSNGGESTDKSDDATVGQQNGQESTYKGDDATVDQSNGDESTHKSENATVGRENGDKATAKSDDAMTGQSNGESIHKSDDAAAGQTNGESIHKSDDAVMGQSNGESIHKSDDAMTGQSNGESIHKSDDAEMGQSNGESIHKSDDAMTGQSNGDDSIHKSDDSIHKSDDAAAGQSNGESIHKSDNAAAGQENGEKVTAKGDGAAVEQPKSERSSYNSHETTMGQQNGNESTHRSNDAAAAQGRKRARDDDDGPARAEAESKARETKRVKGLDEEKVEN